MNTLENILIIMALIGGYLYFCKSIQDLVNWIKKTYENRLVRFTLTKNEQIKLLKLIGDCDDMDYISETIKAYLQKEFNIKTNEIDYSFTRSKRVIKLKIK